jgi:diaminohydroxyphosphoribosylaminopyrimidine deaminase / 5-amino-6-(5-phosphoribosylamino)uracil reductase
MPANAHYYDDIYMERCLELALKGAGFTRPNPMVGAVIVHNRRIIGEGYHQKAGEPHAEVNAVNSVADRSLLKGATIYVNLEPCSHFGKTPPCADLIIESGIKRVVAGTTDTSSKVAGKGFEKLLNAGIDVAVGVKEEECRYINRRFFSYHEKKRPLVILKWAESPDGYIDFLRKSGAPVGTHWITGMQERVLVHRWRSEEDAILAGGATVRADDPALNVRHWTGIDPVKVIVSKSGNISPQARLFKTPGKVFLFTSVENTNLPAVTFITKGKGIPVKEILDTLYEAGIQSVIIEGGATILGSFITSGLWDEARVFTGKAPFKAGIKAPDIYGKLKTTCSFAKSNLNIFVNE